MGKAGRRESIGAEAEEALGEAKGQKGEAEGGLLQSLPQRGVYIEAGGGGLGGVSSQGRGPGGQNEPPPLRGGGGEQGARWA